LPFEKLVAELQPERSLKETPLFRVMFTWHNEPRLELDLAGLRWEPIRELEEISTKYDLTLAIYEEKESLPAAFEYNRDLFDETTITRMVQHFQNLIRGITLNPKQRLSELPLLGADELRDLAAWNEVQYDR
jgi:non-ribosomal peptide synthetase component F